MKKFFTPLFAVFFVLVISSLGFGQSSTRDFTYYDDGTGAPEPPIGNACPLGQGTPMPDGSALISLFWDNNGNGPDPSDVQPTQSDTLCYGCVNFNGFQMNGEMLGVGPGYFSTQADGHTVSLGIIPDNPPDLPRYYWRINADLNGDSVCWTSSVFTFTTGYEDVYLAASDWTCTTGRCPLTGTPPAAPTNVQVTDDTHCMEVVVSWEHTGVNVSGFNIYDESGIVAGASGGARNVTVQLDNYQTHNYYVTATNVFGSSPASNHDNGSGYLLRFAADAANPSGNLHGDYPCPTNFTIGLARPEETCGSLDSLFLLTSSNVMTFLCVDSLVTQMSCTLPDLGTETFGLRLVVRAYYFARPLMEADTTDSTFNLCTVSAGEHTLLIPDKFALEQNYPNPFNPTTTIDFSVPIQSDLRIDVYNITGQLVKTLVSGSITAGVHHITWDGMSNGGISVSSGLYFYRMSGPGFVQTKKMLMLK